MKGPCYLDVTDGPGTNLSVDLTMKRPDSVPETPDNQSVAIPHSRRSSVESTRPLEDLSRQHREEDDASRHLISDAVRDIGPQDLNEFSMLSESNHAHHLLESYKASAQAALVRTNIERVSGEQGPYGSVWVDTQATAPFSLFQFLHELVSLLVKAFDCP